MCVQAQHKEWWPLALIVVNVKQLQVQPKQQLASVHTTAPTKQLQAQYKRWLALAYTAAPTKWLQA